MDNNYCHIMRDIKQWRMGTTNSGTRVLQLVLLTLLLPREVFSDLENLQRVYPPVGEPGDNRIPLHIGLMLSFGGGFTSIASAPGVQIALDLINNDTHTLPGYKLHYSLSDSQCDQSVALESFFHEVVWREPVKYGLIGGGCSVATEPTAAISHFYNITQLSCASASPELRDRSKFPKYFQVLATAFEVVPAYLGLMQYFGWNQVVILQQEENLFSGVVDAILILFREANNERRERGDTEIEIILKTFSSSGGVKELGEQKFDDTATIYILAMYSGFAKPFICEAYHRGMTYPRYVFVTFGWYLPHWWTSQEGLNCTTQQMETALTHSLAVFSQPGLLNSSEVVEAGISRGQLERDTIEILETDFGGGFDYIHNAEQCFDAVWAFAIALNKTMQDLETDPDFNDQAKEDANITENRPFRLEDFTYSNGAFLERMFSHLNATNFSGITGPVSFSEEGIREVSRLRVQQYRPSDCNPETGTCLEILEIGLVFVDDNSFVYLRGEDNSTTWPRGIPHDGTPREEIVTIALPLTIVMYIFATAGVVFAIVCLAFVFYFRAAKLIRLSSPNLNYVTCSGALILYISVYFYTIHSDKSETVTILCNFRVWLSAVGYSLAFGPVLGKMWRVYHIFTNPRANKKAIKDWHLIVFVAVLAAVDIVILTVATAIPTARLKAKLEPNEENMYDENGEFGQVTNYYVYLCDSESVLIWLGIIFGYKAILQIIGLLLAFGTRKVKVEGLNDAKFIGGIIYITSITLTVIIVSFVTLADYLHALAAVFSIGYLVSATVILGLIFLPKMIALYKDPEGKKIFSRNTVMQSSMTAYQFKDSGDKISSLQEKVVQLEAELAAFKGTKALPLEDMSVTHSSDALPPEDTFQIKSSPEDTFQTKSSLEEAFQTKSSPDP